jgi:hypothetical protein
MRVTCDKHGKRMFLVRCEGLGVEEHTYVNQHLVFTVKLERIKNAIRRLLAGERHKTVQPLLSPRPEHFNLDAKSEHAGNVREAYGYLSRLYRELVMR